MSIIQLVYEVHIGVCREQIFINYVWYWFSWDIFIEERVQGTTEVWINLMEINKQLLNCVQLYCCTTVKKLFIVVKFTHLTYLSTKRIDTSVCVSILCVSVCLSVCLCLCLSVCLSLSFMLAVQDRSSQSVAPAAVCVTLQERRLSLWFISTSELFLLQLGVCSWSFIKATEE